ncbi:MAG TPA: hypothetical protein PK728_09735 [Bacillota bacterium]|nr:hypothetical protein [Bacillota bacterium]
MLEDDMCLSCFHDKEDYAPCGNGFCKDCCDTCFDMNEKCMAGIRDW